MSKINDELLYSESHEWVKVDGNIAIIGVSDFAQEEMGIYPSQIAFNCPLAVMSYLQHVFHF